MEKDRNRLLSKAIRSSVKHCGGTFMPWTCIAANRTGSVVFIDDVTVIQQVMQQVKHSHDVTVKQRCEAAG